MGLQCTMPCNGDRPQNFKNSRSLTACSARWTLFEFRISGDWVTPVGFICELWSKQTLEEQVWVWEQLEIASSFAIWNTSCELCVFASVWLNFHSLVLLWAVALILHVLVSPFPEAWASHRWYFQNCSKLKASVVVGRNKPSSPTACSARFSRTSSFQPQSAVRSCAFKLRFVVPRHPWRFRNVLLNLHF